METEIDLPKTALLIIDMQKAFVKDEKGVFSDVSKLVESNRVIEKIAKVLKAAREAEIPIIHLRIVREKDGSDIVETVSDLILEGLALPAKQLLEGVFEGAPGAEFVEELKPASGEHVIVKRKSSGFYNTGLESLLLDRGIDTLIITGIVTMGCVENTVRSARDRDFHVIVLRDCCADRSKEEHEYPLKNTFRRMGRVRTSDEIVAALAR